MRLHPSTPAGAPEIAHAAVPATRRRRSPLQRGLLQGGGIPLLLLRLVLAPPLINANRYRIKIADTMSASLSRPVHLDDVSFHFLPVPGFTLSNLVVSEDPAFGAEPTIRANTVEATLRVSSLWHRPIEFSTVRFVDPSVNLVRNAEGRWNLSDILMHASRVNSAPTGQRHAGPAPRFPYIEATGGRVNLKLGAEKLPFSLTEADFALWLPSAEQWRVRLVGHPARTDTNITDPGTVRLEGELRRADTAAAVPVNFRANWHDAPLGEASRILTGDDLGWRGSVNLDATLAGTLGDGRLAGKLTLGGLRRAEFFPARPLDLQITCGSGFQLHPAVLTRMQCTLPDDAPQPLRATAEEFDPQQPGQSRVAVQGEAIPARWALLWAALFSARVPTDLRPAGTLSIDVMHGAYSPPSPAPAPAQSRRAVGQSAATTAKRAAGRVGWSGRIELKLPPAAQTGPLATEANPATVNELHWQVTPAAGDGWPVLTLPSTEVRLGPNAVVTLSATVGNAGYTLTVNGNAPAAALLVPARYLPQLGDGTEQVLPFPPTSTDPLHVALSCAKNWNTAQICTGPQAPALPRFALTGTRASPRTQTASPLTPRNLSPLEQAPFSTPRPSSSSRPPK